MAKNELSSRALATLASKVLKGYEPTGFEIRELAACVLTQAADKPKAHAKGKRVVKRRRAA